MAFNINDDHWAFLEDMEAPMWVDLNLEVKSYKQDIDDKWFYRSHQFHEFSSIQLKSAFSHSGEVSTTLDSDLSRPSSPKLPTSVSKSRGKDFMSKKWRTDNQDLSLDKLHPFKVLSQKSSSLKSGSCDEIKQTSRFIHLKETTSLKSNLDGDSCVNENIMTNFSNPVSANEDPTSDLSSVANKAKESNTTSTITSESGQEQQQKVFDVSSQTFGHTGSFLSAVRSGLRKSGVTRQASRMVIRDDRKQSSGNKSSSSKSSVASSNPGHDVGSSKSTLVKPKERTPDGRNVGRMTQAAKSKIRYGNVVKSSTMKLGEATSNNRRGGKPNIEKSAHQEAIKRKVQHQTLRKRALGSSKVNEQNSTTAASKPKEKSEIVGFNKLAGNGKENETSQKCNSRGVAAGGMIGGQKGTQKSVPQRNDIAGRLQLQGKVRVQCNLKSQRNVIKGPGDIHIR